jgi:RNA polymerase sigma factor (TIGR02999 family)
MPTKATKSEFSRVLQEAGRLGADRVASDRLYALVYDELRRMASGFMRRERAGHTLPPTAVVHEAYLRLVDPDVTRWENRAHFFGVAARAMRQILVEHARRRAAGKRGGGWQRITFDEEILPADETGLEILALHDALENLIGLDERVARVVELRTFGGLTVAEIAEVLHVSKRTVDGDWRFAKKWLRQQLEG